MAGLGAGLGPKEGGQKAGKLHMGNMKTSTGKTQCKRTDQVRGRAVQSKLGVSWVPSQLPLGFSSAACCSFFDHSIASCDCNTSTDPSASHFSACVTDTIGHVNLLFPLQLK